MMLSELSKMQMRIKKRDCEKNTILKYEMYWKTIFRYLGNPDIVMLSSIHLDDFYLCLRENGRNQNSIYQIHLLLKNALNIAFKARLIHENPAQFATPPKQKYCKMDALKLSSYNAIKDNFHKMSLRWRLITLLLAFTARRRGEIAALKYENISWSEKTILSDASLQISAEGVYEKGTKNGINAIDPLPDALMLLLWDYCETNHISEGYVFRQERKPEEPMRPDSITQFFYRIGKKLGFPCSPHRFRHMVATVLIESGAADWEVASKLCHKDIQVTRRIYIHVSREPILRIPSLLEKAYSDNPVDAT